MYKFEFMIEPNVWIKFENVISFEYGESNESMSEINLAYVDSKAYAVDGYFHFKTNDSGISYHNDKNSCGQSYCLQ